MIGYTTTAPCITLTGVQHIAQARGWVRGIPAKFATQLISPPANFCNKFIDLLKNKRTKGPVGYRQYTLA